MLVLSVIQSGPQKCVHFCAVNNSLTDCSKKIRLASFYQLYDQVFMVTIFQHRSIIFWTIERKWEWLFLPCARLSIDNYVWKVKLLHCIIAFILYSKTVTYTK